MGAFARQATAASRDRPNFSSILVHKQVSDSRDMRGDNDNPAAGGEVFRPSPVALLLPVAVIAAGYLALFAWLYLSDRSAGAIARLCLVVLSLGVPFLVAHALLRVATIRVQLLPHAILAHTGFPRGRAHEIPYGMMRGLVVRRSLAGRMLGGGTLTILMADGVKLAIPDLRDPDAVVRGIEEKIAAEPPKIEAEGRRTAISAHF